MGVLALLIFAGVALAATISCGSKDCYGTKFQDTMTGNRAANWIDARPGEDYVDGRAGADYILGNRESDVLYGGSGDDELRAGKHMEFNELYGEDGSDILNGVDEFPPGAEDYLDCGPGVDTAYVDGWTDARPDVTVGCENVVPSVCRDVYPDHLCVYPWPE